MGRTSADSCQDGNRTWQGRCVLGCHLNVGYQGFYEAISFCEECADAGSGYTVVPSKTIAGQIATFIEALHLTYDDVFRRIPFRTLLLMLKDKQHTTSGDVMVEVDEDEFFGENKPWERKQ